MTEAIAMWTGHTGRRFVLLVGLILAAGTIAGFGFEAQAQSPGPDPYGEPVQTPWGLRRGVPVQALPSPASHGGSCVKWCAADQTPCDPDYYKVADRRCNPNQSGYYN